MKVSRVISVYDKISDELIKDFPIDHISTFELKNILEVKKDDPEVYMVYPLSKSQLSELSNRVPELSKINLDTEELFIECFQA